MADRAVWREHEQRAGDLVVERELVTEDFRGRRELLSAWQVRLAAEPPERLGSALMLVVRMLRDTRQQGWWDLREPLAALLRKPFEVSDGDALLAARIAAGMGSFWDQLVVARIAEVMVSKRFGPSIVDEAAAGVVRDLIDSLDGRGADGNQQRVRLQRLLPATAITQVDGWAADVAPRLTDPAAAGLLQQLTRATGSKPGKGWATETARMLADPAERAVLRLLVERLVQAAPKPVRGIIEGRPVDVLVDERNADLVRAAIWATASLDEPWVVPALLAIGLRSFESQGGWIAVKVPNAAILTLGQIGGPDAVAALSTLDARASDNGSRKRIAAAVAAAGEAEGLSPGQVLERMVPTGGFDTDGTVEIARGSATGRATLNADLKITITWQGEGADSDVNAIKRQVKELRDLVASERRRVEGLFAEDRDWDVADWRRYYLDHPITGRIAARLLWRFDDETRLGGDDLPTRGRVRLWHPASATTDEVARWRDKLLEQDLRQPFKQAFREVYLLTDAERETRLYSNRFAAHVLRYGQAYALFKERGWVANYLGPYDGGFEGRARREFRDAGLTAVFEHFPVDDNRQGAPELCTTDRVWFHRTAGRAREPIPVDEVPPLVFSEAMRDVDLFVGVASIALDPQWYDRDDDPHYEYWQQVSFGELSATAHVRRDVLARILPRLAVADQVELGDRFVRVRGKRATYRIHLGSANIMIEPDDRYLCVVPNRGKGKRVLLPFDGDEVLSVILSKVMLLAADDKITDTTILSQIASRSG